jgi:hypothetical protein
MFLCGGLVAYGSLGIRWCLSGYRWQSDRHFMSSGGWGWQFVDAALAFVAGSVLLPRMAWLGVSALAWLFGHELPGGRLQKFDFWALAVPSTLLAYLIYVANRRNASFWPVGLGILVVYFALRRVAPCSAGDRGRWGVPRDRGWLE